jgi:hypothetical protein
MSPINKNSFESHSLKIEIETDLQQSKSIMAISNKHKQTRMHIIQEHAKSAGRIITIQI